MSNTRWIKGWGVLVALAVGCGSATGAGPKGKGGPLALQNGADDPPHVFTARSHPPRTRPAPPPVDVSAMPRMVERSAQCFAGGADDQIAAPKKKKRASKGKAKKPHGFVPFSPAPGGTATPTTPTTTN